MEAHQTGKGKVVAIHQPNFCPWLGYFYKMCRSDLFIILDDVQFTRRGYTHRVKVKLPSGPRWLTVPVMKRGRYHQQIRDVEVEREGAWKRKMIMTLRSAYGRTPFFNTFIGEFEEILHESGERLSGLNIRFLQWIVAKLDLPVTMVRSSELSEVPEDAASTRRLIALCLAVGADSYLSGFGGVKYQDPAEFGQAGIELMTTGFRHPRYTQAWGGFCEGLSILDLMFNCGREGRDFLFQN